MIDRPPSSSVLPVWGGVLILGLFGYPSGARADEPVPVSPWPAMEILPGVPVEPHGELEFRSLYYGSDPGPAVHCLENSEADCLEEGYNGFADLRAGARLAGRLDLAYEGQWSEDDRRNKRAFVRLRTGTVSWEFGKDAVWLGHGYHGSLLLSNNAEGFLLFQFQTESPFRLPWILSRIGEFDYRLFHGWMEEFRLFGHRAEYRPVSFLSIGAAQTVFYEERFSLREFHRILSAAEENVSGRYDNDQRASVDAALYLPFLGHFSPFVDGKLYGELAGEDLAAFWQKGDRGWVKPLGFNFLSKGGMGGLFLTTGSTDLRLEYSQNYGGGDDWYAKFPFENEGVPMGHHMGSQADDWFVEIVQRFGALDLALAYDRERHGVDSFPDRPEIRDQIFITPSYGRGRIRLFAQFIYAHYRNVDQNPDPLIFDIDPGSERDEYTIGAGITAR